MKQLIREEGVVVNASYSCTKRSKTREKNVGKKRYGLQNCKYETAFSAKTNEFSYISHVSEIQYHKYFHLK